MADIAKAELMSRIEASIDLYNTGDIDRFMKTYTEGATLMAPDADPVVGMKDCTESTAQMMKTLPRCVHEKNEYFELMAEDKACTNDFYAMYGADGKLAILLHEFCLWKKLNGEWYIDRGIYNNRPMPETDPRKQIERRIQALYDAFNRDDYDAAVGMYTEDATVVPHDGQVSTGRPAIKEIFREVIPDMKTLVVDELYHFELLNDQTAYTNSHMRAVGDDGTLKAIFRDCLIWKKLDGEWYIRRDFFNDRPMPKE